MSTLSASKAKAKFLKLLRNTHDIEAKYTITHKGEPYAVLLSVDEYEGLLETLAILQNKTLASQLFKSIKSADSADTLSFEAVVGRKQRK